MRKATCFTVPLFLAFAATVYACGGGGRTSGCGGFSSFGSCGRGGYAGFGSYGRCGVMIGGCDNGGYSGYGISMYSNSGCQGCNIQAVQPAAPTQAVQPAAPTQTAAPALRITPAPQPAAAPAPQDVRPATPPVPVPLPAPQDVRPVAPTMKPTTFHLRVPADAVVYINGHQTTSVGDYRTYMTWTEVGKTYTYDFVVQTTRNGQIWQDAQTYMVQSNERYDLAFQPAPPKPRVMVVNNP